MGKKSTLITEMENLTACSTDAPFSKDQDKPLPGQWVNDLSELEAFDLAIVT